MYICGKNVAKEYLESGELVNKIMILENFDDSKIINLAQSKCKNIKIVKKEVIDKITKENHQGIVLEIPEFIYSNLDEIIKEENPLLVILDHIEDPHNFGAIIRTCEAAGVDGIIIPKNRSVDVTPSVIRTSVGATKYVPIVQITNISSTMKELKRKGFWIVGTDMEGTPYQDIDYKGKMCVVIGNEGHGMARIVKENCDFIATIPMKGKINSLNASVAAGVVIYQAINKRG
ncbi:MAG: 23S rRNA (guanosine(2251)-2'-O)-methyltransferase RlmB [Bacilli bacterium]